MGDTRGTPTPVPWQVRKTALSDKANYQRGVDLVVETVAEGADNPDADEICEITSANETEAANAAFIVMACNNHAALAEIARAAVKYDDAIRRSAATHGKSWADVSLDTLYENWIAQARSVLASVEGGAVSETGATLPEPVEVKE